MRAVVSEHGDAIAVRDGKREISYADLARMVGTYRAMLRAADPEALSPVGLLLDRSAEAYAAMWAAIGEGRAYVPLNLRYPESRLRVIVEAAGVEQVICLDAHRETAKTLGIASEKLVVLDDASPALPESEIWAARRDAGTTAYLLYTSGSTGKPKGVPISFDNLAAFIDAMAATIPYPAGSICSQVCELSFDFSVHEIFLALLSGCTLCPARQIDLFNPAQFIRKNRVSVWISVPSLVRVLLANRPPNDGVFESLRLSIFNGEPLTTQVARDWQAAAPGATLWNNYGPTECTVAVTAQRWEDDPELSEIEVVSIGTPLPGCEVAVRVDGAVLPLDDPAREVTGELLLKSAQRFAGYTDPAIAAPFVTDASGETYYTTGDKVLWRGGRLFHLGRLDHQVKVGGHRIELMEVEFRLRRGLGTDALAVLPFPTSQPTELVLFLEGAGDPPKLEAEALGLPLYMIPKRVRHIEKLPITAHGKLDRIALRSELEAEG